MVDVGDAAHEHEAEAERALAALTRLARRGEAGARVLDLEDDRACARGPHAEARDAAAVPPRVLEQVREGAREQRRVALEGKRARVRAHVDDEHARLGNARALERAARDVDGVERAHREVGEVEARAREQMPHERVDLEDLALELVERLGVAAARAPELEQHADARERRADLVRDAREQLALIADLLLDASRHVVDGRPDVRDLAHVPRPELGARREPSRADLLGHAQELVQRPREPVGDLPRDEPQHEARGEHGDEAVSAAREAVDEVRDPDREEDRDAEPNEEPAVQVRRDVEPPAARARRGRPTSAGGRAPGPLQVRARMCSCMCACRCRCDGAPVAPCLT